MSVGRRPGAAALLLAFAVGATGCGGAPILANPPIVFPSLVPAASPPARPADPVPISFPRDDGPHDRLTEWWYYTGHLKTADGRRFGFEAVVFRAERGAVPAAWAAHLALTDEAGNRFIYAQRSELGPAVDRSPRDGTGSPTGFDLQVGGVSPLLIAAGVPARAVPWRLTGANGTDHIEAALTPEESAAAGASFGLSLDLTALKEPALHDQDGFVDFGPAGSSYYYSRTRLTATGMLQLDGQSLKVDGIVWFDHQWGDFVSVGGGGWDWLAINLDDGTDLTVSVVLDERANPVLQYGTLVRPTGEIENLGPDVIGVGDGGDRWESPISGRTYGIGKDVVIVDLVYELRPTVPDQELDTRATTGVIYWEGSEVVRVMRVAEDGTETQVGGGDAYLEMTRYDAPRT
ncbi:MAG: carotenoid 1,2-hydratase [Chloroflexi bacterium]|nr:carotenoid 1,2-hydratase [Chloroflexota bacterium]